MPLNAAAGEHAAHLGILHIGLAGLPSKLLPCLFKCQLHTLEPQQQLEDLVVLLHVSWRKQHPEWPGQLDLQCQLIPVGVICWHSQALGA